MIPVRREGLATARRAHARRPSKWPFIIPLGLAFVFAGLVFHPGRGGPVIKGGRSSPSRAADHRSRQPAAHAASAWPSPSSASSAGISTPAANGTMSRTRPGILRHRAAAWGEPTTRASVLPAGMHLPGPSPWPFLAPLGLGVIFFGLVFNPVFIVAGVLMAIVAAGGWYLDAGREYRAVEAGHPLDGSQVDPASRLPNSLLGVYATIGVVAIVIASVPAFVAWVNPAPTEAPAASLSPQPDRHRPERRLASRRRSMTRPGRRAAGRSTSRTPTPASSTTGRSTTRPTAQSSSRARSSWSARTRRRYRSRRSRPARTTTSATSTRRR